MLGPTISCSTHCCPIHGCKYSKEDCPIKSGKLAPVYQLNNGCERCEFDREETLHIIEISDELIDAVLSLCSDAYQAGQSFRPWPYWQSNDERGYTRRRLLESLGK